MFNINMNTVSLREILINQTGYPLEQGDVCYLVPGRTLISTGCCFWLKIFAISESILLFLKHIVDPVAAKTSCKCCLSLCFCPGWMKPGLCVNLEVVLQIGQNWGKPVWFTWRWIWPSRYTACVETSAWFSRYRALRYRQHDTLIYKRSACFWEPIWFFLTSNLR